MKKLNQIGYLLRTQHTNSTYLQKVYSRFRSYSLKFNNTLYGIFTLNLSQQQSRFSTAQGEQRASFPSYIIDNRFFDNVSPKTKYDLPDPNNTNTKISQKSSSSESQNIDKMQLYIVILNMPLCSPQLIRMLKLHPDPIIVCADGGANRLFEFSTLYKNDKINIKPEAIVGNMKSLDIDAKNHYQHLGVRLVDKSFEEDTTDLHKALQYVSQYHNERFKNQPRSDQQIHSHQSLKEFWQRLGTKSDKSQQIQEKGSVCVVLGAFGGRMDLTLDNLCTLQKFHYNPDHLLYFMNKESMLFKVPKGHTQIKFSQDFEWKKDCGIVSIQEAYVKTKGMTWELGDDLWSTIGLDSQISTSNVRLEDTVEINTNKDIIFVSGLSQEIHK